MDLLLWDIKEILKKHNKNDKHQQDFIQWQGDIARCICVGTHASGPHLTKHWW